MKIKGCNSKTNHLSILCIIYLVLWISSTIWLFLAEVYTFDTFSLQQELSPSPSPPRINYILFLVFRRLIIFLPQIFLLYKACQYKCKWIYFIIYSFIIFMFGIFIIDRILQKLYGIIFPKFYQAYNEYLREQEKDVFRGWGYSEEQIIDMQNNVNWWYNS